MSYHIRIFLIFLMILFFSVPAISQLSFSNQPSKNNNKQINDFSDSVTADGIRIITRMSKNSGIFIGAAMDCGVNNNEIQKLRNFYFQSMNNLNLSKEDLSVAMRIFHNEKNKVNLQQDSQSCQHIRREVILALNKIQQ